MLVKLSRQTRAARVGWIEAPSTRQLELNGIELGRAHLTCFAWSFPSYNTNSTLTFSRFPVSVLILPRLLCRRGSAPRDKTRNDGEYPALADCAVVKMDREGDD